MKNVLIVGTTLVTLLTGTVLLASVNKETNKGCDQKITHLEEELTQAKNNNNTHRINGLEISLSNVQEHCTDKGLKEKLEEKIASEQEDLNEHTKDYNEAVSEGKSDKIQKYKMKIEKDNVKIKALTKELNALA